MLADVRAPALLALAPYALVGADARPPALLASGPLTLVGALRALRLGRHPALLLAFPPIALLRARVFLLVCTFTYVHHRLSVATIALLFRCPPASLHRLGGRRPHIPCWSWR